MSSVAITDKFQTREELVQFIDDTASTAVEKAVRTTTPSRRVPWVTSGPVGQDSVGYSVLKAAAFALGYVGPEQAKEEIQTHHQLRDLYAAYGFSPHHGAQSFLVPLASAHLPVFEPQGARLQTELRQKMTAHASKYDPDEAGWLLRRTGRVMTKALGTTDTAGGTLVPLPMLGELIDLQRNLEAFAAAGAQEIALPPNGRIQFPKFTGGSTAYWVGEGAAITDSQPTTGNLDLQAKKLGVLVKMNNELLRFASPSAEGLVRFDMARAAALKADLAMLEGSGGTQIKGVITYSGINSHTASTTGTNGDTFQPEDVAKMESKLPDAVDAPTAWVMRKSLFAALMNRRADSVSAADGKGGFLFRDNRSLGTDRPRELYGTPVVRSSQVSGARTKGSGTTLTYLLLGYFPDWEGHHPDWIIRGPPPRRKLLQFQPVTALHSLHEFHVLVRFPPHSLHDSVHEENADDGGWTRGVIVGGQRTRRGRMTCIVGAVRECFKNGGIAARENEVERGGHLRVGYRGRLFQRLSRRRRAAGRDCHLVLPRHTRPVRSAGVH